MKWNCDKLTEKSLQGVNKRREIRNREAVVWNWFLRHLCAHRDSVKVKILIRFVKAWRCVF